MVMLAANYAGRAINITQTTAPHAMSYKLTSMYGVPHGHAVALCLPEVWRYMQEHLGETSDPRGEKHLESVFARIERIMGSDALATFLSLMEALQLPSPVSVSPQEDLEILTNSVNPVRLKNNPVPLTANVIYTMYKNILNL